VLRKTLCEHVNGLCPAGWLNEQSITKHWFQSVRTCPYSWATGRNNASNDKSGQQPQKIKKAKITKKLTTEVTRPYGAASETIIQS